MSTAMSHKPVEIFSFTDTEGYTEYWSFQGLLSGLLAAYDSTSKYMKERKGARVYLHSIAPSSLINHYSFVEGSSLGDVTASELLQYYYGNNVQYITDRKNKRRRRA